MTRDDVKQKTQFDFQIPNWVCRVVATGRSQLSFLFFYMKFPERISFSESDLHMDLFGKADICFISQRVKTCNPY